MPNVAVGTGDYASKLYLTTGDPIYSNRSNVMLRIERDTVERHDFLLTPCSKDTFRIIYGDVSFVDKASSQYKAPFSELYNTARVYTPADTAVVAPNSDTPYCFIGMDLRAEPVVICNLEIEKSRDFSLQLIDTYTCNYSYTPVARPAAARPSAPQSIRRRR